MEVNKEKIRYILQFFLDKGKYSSQAAEMVNTVYGADIVTTNYGRIRCRRLRSGIFDVKRNFDNVDKITEIADIEHHFSSRSIPQELNIDRRTVL